ncbi:D-alanine--D-alanine ligase [Desulfonatronospira sp.]|uniref:D-alanine--D-alanine ligase family protein n=1 Tax=Desulfonatronospira sp. TaxID=1962951 RepID=UPI0025BA3D90|nr:D-alanine--D-alanine ligase [Desulfonatronospira sp.]
MRVLLIAGGWSKERQVSLNGAAQIKEALKNLGHEVLFLDLSPDYQELVNKAREADAAIINLHGAPGEDGSVQGVLEDVGLPYQGSGVRGSFLALNKALSKQFYSNHGLKTPRGGLYYPQGLLHRIPPPVICKPNLGGSSLDMQIFYSQEEVDSFLDQADSKHEILVEELINGLEVSCAVLDNEPLPPILIQPVKGNFFDYRSKYDPDGAIEICPAPISQEASRRIQEMSLKAHRILGLRHYSRSDFMLDQQDNIYILETNTLPGMTRTSLVPKAAEQAGIGFTDLIARLLSLALNSNQPR